MGEGFRDSGGEASPPVNSKMLIMLSDYRYIALTFERLFKKRSGCVVDISKGINLIQKTHQQKVWKDMQMLEEWGARAGWTSPNETTSWPHHRWSDLPTEKIVPNEGHLARRRLTSLLKWL